MKSIKKVNFFGSKIVLLASDWSVVHCPFDCLQLFFATDFLNCIRMKPTSNEVKVQMRNIKLRSNLRKVAQMCLQTSFWVSCSFPSDDGKRILEEHQCKNNQENYIVSTEYVYFNTYAHANILWRICAGDVLSIVMWHDNAFRPINKLKFTDQIAKLEARNLTKCPMLQYGFWLYGFADRKHWH